MLPVAKFQLALPYLVLPVSPSLAALHTTRVQSFIHSDSCSKCGSYLLHGNATIRIVRLKRPNHPTARALRRLCHACGCMNELMIDAESPDPPSPSILQEPMLAPESLLPPSQSKPRPKKKIGLQDMLSRSREKEKEEQSRRNDGQVGLAEFLTHL